MVKDELQIQHRRSNINPIRSMNYLNSKQLAFILDIEVQEAREKMVYAHCKSNGLRFPKWT